MAPRSFWKGYLKLSLVTCPVSMMPATSEAEKVRFHTLNAATGNRVAAIYRDAGTGEVVEEDAQVKGYQIGVDAFIMLEDEELEAVALEHARTIDIETFVPTDSVAWIWYDRPHYLVPRDAVGEEAFAVIRDAMAATGMMSVARLVLYRRERAVILKARGRGIELWSLRFGDEVRDPDAYFADLKTAEPEKQMLDMVAQLIDGRIVPWDPAMAHDPVQDQLLRIIATRQKGRRPARPRAAPEPVGNVVNIMDALRRSIAAEGGKGRRG